MPRSGAKPESTFTYKSLYIDRKINDINNFGTKNVIWWVYKENLLLEHSRCAQPLAMDVLPITFSHLSTIEARLGAKFVSQVQ